MHPAGLPSGGGGGGGYFGGGGGSGGDFGVTVGSSGGGGSNFVSGSNTTNTQATGAIPPNVGFMTYQAGVGYGGQALGENGGPGLVVLTCE